MQHVTGCILSDLKIEGKNHDFVEKSGCKNRSIVFLRHRIYRISYVENVWTFWWILFEESLMNDYIQMDWLNHMFQHELQANYTFRIENNHRKAITNYNEIYTCAISYLLVIVIWIQYVQAQYVSFSYLC